MTIRDFFFVSLMGYPQPTRTEVLKTLKEFTQDYAPDYVSALKSDFAEMLDEWRYKKTLERLQGEYDRRMQKYYDELHRAEYALAMGTIDPIKWPEEPEPFIPPCPGTYDNGLFIPPMYAYAMRLLTNHIEKNSDVPPDSFNLPFELDTARARKYIGRAVEVGYITPTATGYKWEYRGKAQLGYFVERVYCPTNTEELPEKAVNKLFGVERIGSAIAQLYNAKKPQKWRAEIDNKIFYD